MNIGISDVDRKQMADALGTVLAESFLLYMKTHQFHWNVTGPMFQTLHVMFMEQYTELWNALDELAERIRSLGFFTPGSFQQYEALSSIQEEPAIPKAEDMIQQLVTDQETLIRQLRKTLALAEQIRDQATADLLTQRMEIHEKNAWMLRVLLE